MAEQLTLTGVTPRDQGTFDNFYVADNATLVTLLKAFSLGEQEQFIYLWGAQGSGKSHLLQACCDYATQNGKTAMVFSLDECLALSPDLFEGMEQMQLICLDQIQAIAGNSLWEEALFDFYNRLRDSGARLLVAGTGLPRDLNIQLPDLISRLNWGPAFHLKPMSEEDMACTLQFRAKKRGIVLTEDVVNFLLRRCCRNMKELFETFDKLDKAALAEKRGLTIPFVKGVLGL